MTTNADAPTTFSASHRRSQSWGDILTGNSRIVIVAVAVVVLAVAAYSFFSSRNETRIQEAQSALYQAQKLVRLETPKETRPAPPATAGAKPGVPTEELLETIKLDVDAKMPGSVKALTGVVNKFSHTRAGYDAALTLGDLYQKHGEPAKAVQWYAKSAEIAPDGLGRALANSAQGYALEETGKFADAIQSFERVVNSGESALKGDSLLSMARLHQSMGDTAKATAVYDQISTQMPGTDTAKSAETLRSQLPAAPAAGGKK